MASFPPDPPTAPNIHSTPETALDLGEEEAPSFSFYVSRFLPSDWPDGYHPAVWAKWKVPDTPPDGFIWWGNVDSSRSYPPIPTSVAVYRLPVGDTFSRDNLELAAGATDVSTMFAGSTDGTLGIEGMEIYVQVYYDPWTTPVGPDYDSMQLKVDCEVVPQEIVDGGGGLGELLLTIEPPVDAIRIETTAPPGASSVTITRYGPSGESVGVRSWAPRTVAPGEPIIARDFEAPIGVEITYTLTFDDGSSLIGGILIPSAGCSDTWLTDLARPSNTYRTIIEGLPELSYAIPTTVHTILRRRDPIVSSDVANTPSFQLSLITETLEDRDRVRAIVGNGVPVLLRTPPEEGIGNLYFAVLSFTEQRISALGTDPLRRFTISAIQVARPDPALFDPTPPVTYGDVYLAFDSYAELESSRESYDALLYDYATGASELVPWPPRDV